MTESPALTALLAAGEERFDPYAERILEAARRLLVDYGLRRTSLEDVARAADVSRATLFRRFPNRGALLMAVVAREAQRSIAAVDVKVAPIEEPEEFLVAGVLAVVREAAGNDLLQRLLVTDADQVLPLLTVHSEAIMTLGREYLAAHLRRFRDRGVQIAGDPEMTAEVIARLVLSLALNPNGVVPIDDDEALERLARTNLIPLVMGRGA